MTDTTHARIALRPGDEVRCAHCSRWHVVEQPHANDSTAAQTHLYVTCRGARYFVGTVGAVSRWATRRQAPR